MILRKEFYQNSCKLLASRILALLVFAVSLDFRSVTATDLSPTTSDFSLVGIARFDGASYACLFDAKTQRHLLLSTRDPESGLKLVSVASEDDSVGPSALIQANGTSILLKLGYGTITVSAEAATDPEPVSQVDSAPSTAIPSSVLPMPGTPKNKKLVPPAGASLPLVFRPVNAKALNLTEAQQATIDQLRKDFTAAVTGTAPGNPGAQSTTPGPAGNVGDSAVAPQGTVSSDQQLRNWQSAQELSDEIFKMRFGYQAFTSYQRALLP